MPQLTATDSPTHNSSGGGSGEWHLYIMDMELFWDQIRHADMDQILYLYY